MTNPGRMPCFASGLRAISAESALEHLWLNVKALKSIKPLSCQGLRSLLMTGWDPTETGPLTGNWESLRSLTIVSAAMKDLSSIISLKGLHELHLISCANLSDIRHLSGLSSLRAVNLTDCKMVTDLSALKRMNKLDWLGLPPNISQKQFEDIIREHPGLRVLELIQCQSITDLSPLRSLDRLEALVLLGSDIDHALLGEKKRLRFLALPEHVFKGPDAVTPVPEI